MTRPSLIFLFAAVTALGTTDRADAGFFLEGLAPYSYQACPDRPEYGEPIVSIPPSSVEGSPSAYNDGGIPRFRTQNCPQGQGRGKSPTRERPAPQK